MYLIVGLGNPGREYEKTRHNMGFQVMDKLLNKWNVSLNKDDFHGLYAKTRFNDEDVILLKPMTYMNLSGQSVMEIAHFYKIPTENILVIFDDMDTPPGKIRLREKGSAGGQKGMQNIIDLMHTNEIKRIRIGINGCDKNKVIDYVLGKFNKEEDIEISLAVSKAYPMIESFIKETFENFMNRFNG